MNSIGPNDLVIAALAAVAVAAAVRLFAGNLRVLASARRDASTDPLTGLGNRRQLMEDLEDELTLAAPDDPRIVALLDLDGFKHYNDAFGHPSGDALLARLGRALGAAVCPWGRAYRLGGDEFCVLISDRSPGLEAVLTTAAGALTDHGKGFEVRPSCGMAALPQEAATPEAALELAERRLYAEKSRRREVQPTGDAREALEEALRDHKPARPEQLGGVAALARATGRQLGLGSDDLDVVVRAAELYDVGKMALPDTMLSKPGPLSEEEWGYFRQHTLVGDRILSAAGAMVPVARIVRSSHERFDGGGYPDGLAADDIPLGARIVAVCDAYHAMTTDRPYRRAMRPEAATAELREHAGSQFDPGVVHAFCEALGLEAAAKPRAGRAPRRRTLLAGAALTVLALMSPASALAATADATASQLTVTAASGETNNLTVSTSGTDLLVAETGSGATLTAGTGCTSAGANQVACPQGSIGLITVNALDRDDKVTVTASLPAELFGGADDDQLYGGPLDDTLDGGDGHDWLVGGLGGDNLIGGPSSDYAGWSGRADPITADLDDVADDGQAGEGDNAHSDIETLVGGNADDTLTGNATDNGLDGGPGADTLNGGDGDDYALYWMRTDPVRVDLRTISGNGGEGENDSIGDDVESVIGGAGDDTLIGDSGVNNLWGWYGDDTFDGKGGADLLWGGSGNDTVTYASRRDPVSANLDDLVGDGEAGENDRIIDAENLIGGSGADTLTGDDLANKLTGHGGADTLSGAGGDDEIDSRDQLADDVACGAGRDTVAADYADSVADDCDSVERSAKPADTSPGVDDPEVPAPAVSFVLLPKSKTIRIDARGNLTLRVSCPETRPNGCEGTIVLKLLSGKRRTRASLSAAKRGKKNVLGRGKFSLDSGESGKVKVRLSRNGRRRVLRERKVRCSVNVTTTDENGKRTVATDELTLKAPKLPKVTK